MFSKFKLPYPVVGTLLGSLLLIFGCGQASEDPASAGNNPSGFPLAAAHGPDASLALSFDVESMAASPFAKSLEEHEMGAEGMAMDQLDDEIKEVFEKLGITPDDIAQVAFSMGGLDFDAMDPIGDSENLRMSGAIVLKKALSADQVRSMFDDLLTEEERADLTEESYEGIDLFVGPSDPGMPHIAFGVWEGDAASTILVGDPQGIREMIDRAQAGNDQLPGAMESLYGQLIGESNGWVLFDVPAELRSMIEGEMNDPNNPMGQMLTPLLGLQAVGISLNAQENFDFGLSGLFNEESEAGMVAMMVNSQVLPMANMFLANPDGSTPGFLQRLEVLNEANIFRFRTSFTAEEMIEMSEMADPGAEMMPPEGY